MRHLVFCPEMYLENMITIHACHFDTMFVLCLLG